MDGNPTCHVGNQALDPLEDPTACVGHAIADEEQVAVYAGRDRDDNGRLRHFGNSPIGRRGWLGNPFVLPDSDVADDPATIVVPDREAAVQEFARMLLVAASNCPEIRRALYERVRGRPVGCWCQQLEDDGPLCHAEVIVDVANRIRKR